MRRVAVIPAYQAARTIAEVVRGAHEGFDEVWVIDDGSTDDTAQIAEREGAIVRRHVQNLGKSEALRTALRWAHEAQLDALVTLDADGQHPPAEAARLDREVADRSALVLGVRNMASVGAPRANQRSNGISNWWLSRFAARPLADTQCGLRRYPVEATLALGARGWRYGFECEVVLRAALRGLPIIELPVEVLYPTDRTTHFHNVRDPAHIIAAVLLAVGEEKLRAALRRR